MEALVDRNSPVREIMTKDVLRFGPDDEVEAAMHSLLDRNIDAAPVVDADGKVVGMLSNGDLIVQDSELHFPTIMTFLGGTFQIGHKHFEEELRRALGSKVSEVMSTEPLVCNDDDTIEHAATLMHEHDVSRLPVVSDDRLVGIVSRNDVLRALLNSG
jgi:CBS domain-containing protein